MTPNSLSPASVEINYHTAFAAHKMTIPTKEWLSTSITGTLGSYEDWAGGNVDAEQMVNDLVDKLAVLVPSTTHFDSATIYTMATSTSPLIPRATAALTQVGSSGATAISEAISCTFNFKTLGNHNAKLVLLDFPLGSNGFNKLLPAGFSADVIAVETQMRATLNAWAGRDDTQIAGLRTLTFDLNDKLQKAYRM
jgi:hypothetical protein